jgi:hypothetical protein
LSKTTATRADLNWCPRNAPGDFLPSATAAPLRRKLLERLLRPVGSLALAAIASGAFSAFLLRRVTLEDVARITADQMAELARFVAQVNPDVLQQILSMLA